MTGSRRRRRRSINFARLNHILIPETKAGRDRWRQSRLGRATRPLLWAYHALTDEGQYLVIFLMVAGVLGLQVDRTEIYLLWALLVGALVAAVALRPAFALAGVRARVSAPERVGVGQTAVFTVELTHEGRRAHQALRVRGPFLPWDGHYATPRPRIHTLEPGAIRRVPIGIRFTARGEHHIDAFHAAATVPLGLSHGRPVHTGGSRFVVVPRIAHVGRLATPLATRHQPGGVALASHMGESMELRGIRPYRPGDAVRQIHARSWARLGAPMVREYQQEYFTRIGVVLDTDGEVADEATLEAAISLAAGVVAHYSRGEALIDLLVVGEEVHELTLGRSLGFLEQALDLLACVAAGPALDPDALLGRLEDPMSRLSTVVVVALAWDVPRQTLADGIRRAGVGCRTLVVDDAGEEVVLARTPEAPTRVPRAPIEADRELLL